MSSKNAWKPILENPEFSQSGSKIVFLGISPLCDKESFDYAKSKNCDFIWLNDIRKSFEAEISKYNSQTQAGIFFEKYLSSHFSEYEQIYLSFNLESIIVIFHFNN